MRKKLKSAFFFPYTFVLMNWAPVAGLYHYLRGSSIGIWNPVTFKHTLEKMG